MKWGRSSHSTREGTESQSPLTLWERARSRRVPFCLVVKANTLLILKRPKRPPRTPTLQGKKLMLREELSPPGLITVGAKSELELRGYSQSPELYDPRSYIFKLMISLFSGIIQ